MAMHICEKSNFTFDPNDISSVDLPDSSTTVIVTHKDSKIGKNGLKPLVFDSPEKAKEAYDEIANVLQEYDNSTRPYLTIG